MAAAPSALDDLAVASPELALVDPSFASRLRERLPEVSEDERLARSRVVVRPPAPSTVTPVDQRSEPAPRRPIESATDLIVDHDVHAVAEVASEELLDGASDLIVDHEVDEDLVAAADPSGYPSLPGPEPGSGSAEQTDAVLRDIQQRLTRTPEATQRRVFRRRFTIASGFLAIGALVAFSTQAGLVHVLPGLAG